MKRTVGGRIPQKLRAVKKVSITKHQICKDPCRCTSHDRFIYEIEFPPGTRVLTLPGQGCTSGCGHMSHPVGYTSRELIYLPDGNTLVISGPRHRSDSGHFPEIDFCDERSVLDAHEKEEARYISERAVFFNRR